MVGEKCNEESVKLVYEILLKKRGVYRKFPKEKFKRVAGAINRLGVPQVGFLRAQFYFLSSPFCRRLWGVAYPPVSVLSGPRALYRYRVWATEARNYDQTKYLEEMGVKLELHRRNGEI